jgi:hypothetical protein
MFDTNSQLKIDKVCVKSYKKILQNNYFSAFWLISCHRLMLSLYGLAQSDHIKRLLQYY